MPKLKPLKKIIVPTVEGDEPFDNSSAHFYGRFVRCASSCFRERIDYPEEYERDLINNIRIFFGDERLSLEEIDMLCNKTIKELWDIQKNASIERSG